MNTANGAKAEPGFVPGLDLAAGFFRDAVQPVVESVLARGDYSAALIGPGSEVLGFDTEMSRDHHWGPRALLFLRPGDTETRGAEVRAALAERLPLSYGGYPTNWSAPDAADNGVQHLCPTNSPPVNHRVEVFTVDGFLADYLGIAARDDLSPADWLTLPHQKLRSLCAGRVFHDGLGLEAVRARLAWYPKDVWLYVLASSWARIGQDEHLTGRAGLVGDRVGSAVVASRLVREVMRLGFLMERTYPPYAKWFGTAFGRLACARVLEPLLGDILAAPSWQERDPLLAAAYRHLAEMHNALRLTPWLSPEPSSFWGRPFTVIHGQRFADALREAIQDERVRAIAGRRLIGSIDQFSDSTDLLEDTALRRDLRRLYGDSPGD